MLNDPIAYADQLLAASVVNDGTLNLPVDLEKVVAPLGIEIFAREDLTPDQSPQIGIADKDPNAAAIFVSAGEPHAEQTPKIGGALAALLVLPEDESKSLEERLAQPVGDEEVAWSHAFVSELLVPAGTVAEQWQSVAHAPNTVRDAVVELAGRYAVSEAFMAERLIGLGILQTSEDDQA